MLGPPAGPAFPKGLASWGAARKITKCWNRPPHQQSRRLCCCQHFAIENDKVLGDITTLPPAPCRFLQGGGARTKKMTKCWGRAPGGSVVIYILNGSVWTQVGVIDLLEKNRQRKKRWLVERNRWGPQSPDFCSPGNCTKLHFGAPSTLSFSRVRILG